VTGKRRTMGMARGSQAGSVFLLREVREEDTEV
jgi:hypothetical protein